MSGEKPDSVKRKEILDQTRRGFLKKSGAAVGGAATISGVAGLSSASDQHAAELRSITSEYDSVESVENAVYETGEDLLDKLFRRGLIEEKQIYIDSVGLETNWESPNKAAVFGYVRNGEPTAILQILRDIPSGRLSLFVLPEVQSAHATYTPTDQSAHGKTLTDQDGSMMITANNDCLIDGGTNLTDCWNNPASGCDCDVDDYCGCYAVETQCYYNDDGSVCSCEIINWEPSSCVTGDDGCCTYPDCSDMC